MFYNLIKLHEYVHMFAVQSCDMNQLLRVLWDAILSPVGNGSGNDDDGNMLIENKLASLW